MRSAFPIIFSLLFTSFAVAAEVPLGWSHESEASVVTVSGNTETETYAVKQKTINKWETSLVSLSGRYLSASSEGLETAHQWDSTLRYEKDISASWSGFVQHGAESDTFAGYVQRDNSDVGAKYNFVKTDDESLFTELGLRHVRTLPVGADEVTSNGAGRLYVEGWRKLNETVSGKLWVEYIPSFRDSKDWLANGEASLTVMLNKMFSLKVSYLNKHHELTKTDAEKKDDSTFTTSLVAKF